MKPCHHMTLDNHVMTKINADRRVCEWRIFSGLAYILKSMLNPLITLTHTAFCFVLAPFKSTHV